MTVQNVIYPSVFTPVIIPPTGAVTPKTALTAFFDFAGPPPSAANQPFGGFEPQGTIVSTTPQGFSAFFNYGFTPPLKEAQHPFWGFEPRGQITSITPQGFTAFFDAGRQPASAANFPFASFQARGTIVSKTPEGFSAFFDVNFTLPFNVAQQPFWGFQTPGTISQTPVFPVTAFFDAGRQPASAALQPFLGWPSQLVTPPTPVPARLHQGFFDAGRPSPPTFYFPFWGWTPQLIGGSVPPPFPPRPIPGPFPPNAPTGLTSIIPSYLYQQYNDDDNLQAFVASYNSYAQEYVDWFNNTPLAVYPNPNVSDMLLDWIAQGLYGVPRPALSSGRNKYVGPFNTYVLDGLPFNAQKRVGPSNVVATSDDVYKRCITWAFYKGDGRYFNVRWLKRRVLRFLLGVNGTAPDVSNTDRISVVFGGSNQASIILVTGVRTVTGGALFNRFVINSAPNPFNALNTSFESLSSFADAAIFQEAVQAGVLELPFQFEWTVVI